MAPLPGTLHGKRVLVLRAEGQGEALELLLRERGAESVLLPILAFRPPQDPAPLEHALSPEVLATYDWVLFTSANGVHFTVRALAALRMGQNASPSSAADALRACRIAVIGPGTSNALAEHGLEPALSASTFRGEGLSEALLRDGATIATEARKGESPRALLLRAQKAREVVPETLRSHGWVVDVVAAYESFAPEGVASEVARVLEAGAVDAVVLTSASTVTHLHDLLGARTARLLGSVKVASIGPITTEAAEKLGVRVDGTAQAYTMGGLVDVLESHVFAAGLADER